MSRGILYPWVNSSVSLLALWPCPVVLRQHQAIDARVLYAPCQVAQVVWPVKFHRRKHSCNGRAKLFRPLESTRFAVSSLCRKSPFTGMKGRKRHPKPNRISVVKNRHTCAAHLHALCQTLATRLLASQKRATRYRRAVPTTALRTCPASPLPACKPPRTAIQPRTPPLHQHTH